MSEQTSLYENTTFQTGDTVLVKARSFIREHTDKSPTTIWFGALVVMRPDYIELHSARRVLNYRDVDNHEVLANVAAQGLGDGSYVSRKVARVVVSNWLELMECEPTIADKMIKMAEERWGKD